MKQKVKSIFFMILIFLTYWLGMSFLSALLFFVLHSFVLSGFVAVVVFSIPFLYLLYKKTGINFTGCKTDNKNTRFPLWKLLCVGILLAATAQVYGILFPPVEHINTEITKMEIIASAVNSILVIPITEELFARKWAVSYLEKANVKPVYILFITSFMFFIVHTSYMPLYFRFDTLLSGAVLCYIYTKYHDVRYCIFVHFIINLIVNFIFFANHYM